MLAQILLGLDVALALDILLQHFLAIKIGFRSDFKKRCFDFQTFVHSYYPFLNESIRIVINLLSFSFDFILMQIASKVNSILHLT